MCICVHVCHCFARRTHSRVEGDEPGSQPVEHQVAALRHVPSVLVPPQLLYELLKSSELLNVQRASSCKHVCLGVLRRV